MLITWNERYWSMTCFTNSMIFLRRSPTCTWRGLVVSTTGMTRRSLRSDRNETTACSPILHDTAKTDVDKNITLSPFATLAYLTYVTVSANLFVSRIILFYFRITSVLSLYIYYLQISADNFWGELSKSYPRIFVHFFGMRPRDKSRLVCGLYRTIPGFRDLWSLSFYIVKGIMHVRSRKTKYSEKNHDEISKYGTSLISTCTVSVRGVCALRIFFTLSSGGGTAE